MQEVTPQNQAIAWSSLFVIGALLVAAGLATYYGLDWYFTRSSAQTYQQCVAEGGTILERYPAECITADGRSFTQPVAQGELDPEQAREQQQREAKLEARSRGKNLFFQNEWGLQIETPLDWTGIERTTTGRSDQFGQDFFEALSVKSPDSEPAGEFQEIVISMPVDPAGRLYQDGQLVANGFAGIASAPELTRRDPSFYTVNEIRQAELGGRPAVMVRRQYSSAVNSISGIPEVCAGCWQKQYFVEHPAGIIQIRGRWRADQTEFEQVFDQVAASLRF